MSKKLKKTKVSRNKQSSEISPTQLKYPPNISFSFVYLQQQHPKFSYDRQDVRYFTALLERLKSISTMTVAEMTVQNAKSLRCHPIDWNDSRVTENRFGIKNEKQLVDTPYQLFQLSSNEHGRVHGFFIQNMCYIVWLDPDHKLYS